MISNWLVLAYCRLYAIFYYWQLTIQGPNGDDYFTSAMGTAGVVVNLMITALLLFEYFFQIRVTSKSTSFLLVTTCMVCAAIQVKLMTSAGRWKRVLRRAGPRPTGNLWLLPVLIIVLSVAISLSIAHLNIATVWREEIPNGAVDEITRASRILLCNLT